MIHNMCASVLDAIRKSYNLWAEALTPYRYGNTTALPTIQNRNDLTNDLSSELFVN
jgi:hypothetical protein